MELPFEEIDNYNLPWKGVKILQFAHLTRGRLFLHQNGPRPSFDFFFIPECRHRYISTGRRWKIENKSLTRGGKK